MPKQKNQSATDPKRDTPLPPLMLTPAEIESLRQDKRESIETALRIIKTPAETVPATTTDKSCYGLCDGVQRG